MEGMFTLHTYRPRLASSRKENNFDVFIHSFTLPPPLPETRIIHIPYVNLSRYEVKIKLTNDRSIGDDGLNKPRDAGVILRHTGTPSRVR